MLYHGDLLGLASVLLYLEHGGPRVETGNLVTHYGLYGCEIAAQGTMVQLCLKFTSQVRMPQQHVTPARWERPTEHIGKARVAHIWNTVRKDFQ